MARSLEHGDHPLCLSVSYFGTLPEVHEADQAQAAEGVAPDDVVGQVLASGSFPADVSLGPKPPPISPGGLVAGLLSGRIVDLGLQTLGPKQPGFPPGSAAAKLAAVVHRSLPVPPPVPGPDSSSFRPRLVLPPPHMVLPQPPLPPPPPIAGGSETGKGYGPQTGRSQEPHLDDFAWAFKRGDPPARFRQDGP